MVETCYWMPETLLLRTHLGGYMLHYIHYLFVFLKGVNSHGEPASHSVC